MEPTQNQDLVALIEQHLVKEQELAKLVDDLNESTHKAFSGAGMNAPSEASLERVKPISEEIQNAAIELKASREKLLQSINDASGTSFETLSEAIESIETSDREALDEARKMLFQLCGEARANLIENQATLFYTFDFHRRYIAGVLNCETNTETYGPDGNTVDANRGNLYRKAC